MFKKFFNVTKKVVIGTMLALSLTMAAPASLTGNHLTANVSAATKMRISQKAMSLKVGQKGKLKIKGAKKKIKWSSSNKKIVSVNSKGTVKALRKGSAVIKARVSGKTFTCKVNAYTVAKPKTAAVTSRSGQASSNGVTYKASFKSNGQSTITITNKSGYAIRRGWTGDFYVVIKTTAGQYTVSEDVLQSLINTNNVQTQTIPNGTTCTLNGNLSYVKGTVTSISVCNLYPLKSNGLPCFDSNSWSYVKWGANITMK